MEKNLNLSTDVNVNSYYQGKAVGEVFTKAFEKAPTISKGLITVLTDAKDGKAYLRSLDIDLEPTDYSCGFNPAGSVDYSEKEVDTKKIQIAHEICIQDFRKTWSGSQLSGAYPDMLPNDIETAYKYVILERSAISLDKNIWTGTTASGSFQGILPRLQADSNVIDVTATASITVDNVVGEIDKVYQAIPQNVFDNPSDLVIAVSSDIYRAYQSAQAKLGWNYVFNANQVEHTYYQNVKLENINSLGTKKMVAYKVSNMFFFTDKESDSNELRISNTSDRLEDTLRSKIVYIAGASHLNGEEVVLYS